MIPYRRTEIPPAAVKNSNNKRRLHILSTGGGTADQRCLGQGTRQPLEKEQPSAGREQSRHGGLARLCRPTLCKQWPCNSGGHLGHPARASRGTRTVTGHCALHACVSVTVKAPAAAASGRPWSGIVTVLTRRHRGYVTTELWLLHQPGEKKCVCGS